MKMNECNAIIKRVTISNEDHECLSAWVFLDYGGSGQGFGGFVLYKGDDIQGANYAGHFINRVLNVAGVTRWEDLVGKTVRVRRSSTGGIVSSIEAIGHIIKDDWFDASSDFEGMGHVQTEELEF